MNLICKLLGHKWRDTSYWDFMRKGCVLMKRRISEKHCDRCNKTEATHAGDWIPDE